MAVSHRRGRDIDKETPLLEAAALRGEGGGPGFDAAYFGGDLFARGDGDGDGGAGDGDDGRPEPVGTATGASGQILFFGDAPAGVPEGDFSLRANATYTPEETGDHVFGLVQAGRAACWSTGGWCSTGVTDRPGAAPPSSGPAAARSPPRWP